jgi:hypothetical protein
MRGLIQRNTQIFGIKKSTQGLSEFFEKSTQVPVPHIYGIRGEKTPYLWVSALDRLIAEALQGSPVQREPDITSPPQTQERARFGNIVI